jgi:hypothetical protein
VTFLIFVCSLVILEDISGRLKSLLGISNRSLGHEMSGLWRAIAIAIIVLLVSALHSLLHDVLGDLVIHQGVLGTTRLLIYSHALSACSILWSWLRGAEQHPPRAARYGLLCGLILNAAP